MLRRLSIGIAALLLASCSDSDAPSGDDPTDFIETSATGYIAAPAVTVRQGAGPVWYKAIISGSLLPKDQVPAKIGRLESAKKCSFPKPAAGEKIVQVQTDDSGLTTGVVALTARRLRALSGQSLEDAASAQAAGSMKVVDVVLTDASAPIYLVLAGGNDILWNIQAADGVRVSNVALVSGETAGIANLDPATPVTALAGTNAEECGVKPARLPKDGWTDVAAAAEGDMAAIDLVKHKTAEYEDYNSWFRATFGQDSESVTVGFSRMSHVLVGPAPDGEARMPYHGLNGGTVMLAPTDHVFFATSPEDYVSKFRKLLADS